MMSNVELAKRLTNTLKSTFSLTLFNPWRDPCADCEPSNGPDAKLARLAAHLACNPKFILCGEAPSHRGCRHSGIAFTSECQLLDERIPRISKMNHRLTSGAKPYFERSAMIVWDELYKLGIEECTILWNALPMHPHRLGEPHSNRTPTSEEIKKGEPALRMLVDKFPSAKVVAVGRTAERLLKRMDVRARCVRHPARGGAKAFAQQLERFVRG
jgi:Uracil DNA glycosylase superfamily